MAKCLSKWAGFGLVSIFPFVMTGELTAAAAPAIYVPSSLHVSGRLYHTDDSIDPRFKNADGQKQFQIPALPVEAWYFEKACILSIGWWSLPQEKPQRRVYIYWYDGKAPDDDFGFQQWTTPRAGGFDVSDPHYLPLEAKLANPLWHLLDYQRWSSTAEVGKRDERSTDGTRIVQLHETPISRDGVDATFDLNFQTIDDRVLSMTSVVNHRYSPTRQKPGSPPNETLLTYKIEASDFDQEFPAVPRKIRQIPFYPGGSVAVLDSVKTIPSNITLEAVLEQITQDMQRVHTQSIPGDAREEPADLIVENFAGNKMRIGELIKGKTALIFSWASWAPDDLRDASDGSEKPPYEMLNRLKALYTEYGKDKNVAIIGVSLDVDRAEAQAFIKKHNLPWENYLVPADKRDAAPRALVISQLPTALAINRRGQEKLIGVEEVLGSRFSENKTDVPLRVIVKEDRGAEAAGGYAKYWLGPEVIDVLTEFEKVEVLTLTGHNVHELLMEASMPPMLPPPLPAGPGQLMPPPPPARTPIPDEMLHSSANMPTSITILIDYPVKEKVRSKDSKAARQIAALLMDDNMVKDTTGENYPTPDQAITFWKGNKSVSLVGGGSQVQVFLNDEQEAFLFLTEEGTEKYQQIYDRLATSAGLKVPESR